MDNNIIICPHCNYPAIIDKINCGIFRHGVIKETGKQMKPHLDQSACEQLIQNNSIYGCGKPFKIIFEKNSMKAIICGYI